jgi:Putative Actinobacterial Holin-X, holin superfamily III
MATDPPASPAPPPAASDAPPRPLPGARAHQTPIPQLVTDLRDLVVAYVKQETVVPLKSLGRWIGFGVAGSLLLGFGVVFLAMSGLRALQTETGDTFTGDWSWVPYLIMVFALVLGGALVWVARGARKARKGRPA